MACFAGLKRASEVFQTASIRSSGRDEHLRGRLHRCNDSTMFACCCRQVRSLQALWHFLLICAFAGSSTLLAADYKPEFKMSLVVNQENSWGQAAKRFVDAVRYRTQGRIYSDRVGRKRLPGTDQFKAFDPPAGRSP